MKALLLTVLASACAMAPGPKRPDESHRIPVNRAAPPEAREPEMAKEAASAPRKPWRDGEVEWR